MFNSFIRRTPNIRPFDRFANRVKGVASRGSPGGSYVSPRRRFYVATPLGFEPRITPPKGAVLPLHHGVCGLAILDWRFSIQAQCPKFKCDCASNQQLAEKIKVE